MVGLYASVLEYPGFAFAHEGIQPVCFNICFGSEAFFFLDFHFNPQALAVKAILVAQFAAAHGPKAVVEIFIGASPAVMDAHGVVGGNRPVDERPFGLALAQGARFLEGIGCFPEVQHLVFLFNKINFIRYLFECHISLQNKKKNSRPLRDESIMLPAVPPGFPPRGRALGQVRLGAGCIISCFPTYTRACDNGWQTRIP